MARDAAMASKVDDRLWVGAPTQGQEPAPRGDTRPQANRRPRVDDGRDPAEVYRIQPLEVLGLEGHAVARRTPRGVDNEHKRAKRWTAFLFSSCKPKPSELQLRKGALLRRTPRPCLAQAPLPLPISLASRISAAAPFFKRPLAGPLASRRRAKGLERCAGNLPPEDQRRMASM